MVYITDSNGNGVEMDSADAAAENEACSDESGEDSRLHTVFPSRQLRGLEDGLGRTAWILHVHLLTNCLGAAKDAFDCLSRGGEAKGVKPLHHFVVVVLPEAWEKCFVSRYILEWSQEVVRQVEESAVELMGVVSLLFRLKLRSQQLSMSVPHDMMISLTTCLEQTFDPHAPYHRRAGELDRPMDVDGVEAVAAEGGELAVVSTRRQLLEVFARGDGQRSGFQLMCMVIESNVQELGLTVLRHLMAFMHHVAKLVQQPVLESFVEASCCVLAELARIIQCGEPSSPAVAASGGLERLVAAAVAMFADCYALQQLLLGPAHAEAAVSQVQRQYILLLFSKGNFNHMLVGVKELAKMLERAATLQPSAEAEEGTPLQGHVEWLQEHDIVSKILRTNLHQKQYVEQVRRVLDTLLAHAALQDRHLDMLWALTQQEATFEAVKNHVYDLLAHLSGALPPCQLDWLMTRIQDSKWQVPGDVGKLLTLLRHLTGQSPPQPQLQLRCRHLLWTLMMAPGVLPELVNNDLWGMLVRRTTLADSQQELLGRIQDSCDVLRRQQVVYGPLVALDTLLHHFCSLAAKAGPEARITAMQELEAQCQLRPCLIGCVLHLADRAQSLHLTGGGSDSTFDGSLSFRACLSRLLSLLRWLAVQYDGVDGCQLTWPELSQLWSCLVGQLGSSFRDVGFDFFSSSLKQPSRQQMPRLCSSGSSGTDSPACQEDDEAAAEQSAAHGGGWIAVECQKRLLEEGLQDLAVAALPLSGWVCLRQCCLHVNLSLQHVRCIDPAPVRAVQPPNAGCILQAVSSEFIGRDTVWRAALDSEAEEVAQQAQELLVHVFTPPPQLALAQGGVDVTRGLIQDCLAFLRAATELLLGVNGCSPQTWPGWESGAPLLPPQSPVDPEQYRTGTLRAQRCLKVLRQVVLYSQGKSMPARPAHRASHRSRSHTLEVHAMVSSQAGGPGGASGERRTLEVSDNDYVGQVRHRIALWLGCSASRVRLLAHGRECADDSLLVSASPLNGSRVVNVCSSQEPNAYSALPADAAAKLHRRAAAQQLAQLPQLFDLLFFLQDYPAPPGGGSPTTACQEEAYSLLQLLPTNRSVAARLQQALQDQPPEQHLQLLLQQQLDGGAGGAGRLLYLLQCCCQLHCPKPRPDSSDMTMQDANCGSANTSPDRASGDGGPDGDRRALANGRCLLLLMDRVLDCVEQPSTKRCSFLMDLCSTMVLLIIHVLQDPSAGGMCLAAALRPGGSDAGGGAAASAPTRTRPRDDDDSGDFRSVASLMGSAGGASVSVSGGEAAAEPQPEGSTAAGSGGAADDHDSTSAAAGGRGDAGHETFSTGSVDMSVDKGPAEVSASDARPAASDNGAAATPPGPRPQLPAAPRGMAREELARVVMFSLRLACIGAAQVLGSGRPRPLLQQAPHLQAQLPEVRLVAESLMLAEAILVHCSGVLAAILEEPEAMLQLAGELLLNEPYPLVRKQTQELLQGLAATAPGPRVRCWMLLLLRRMRPLARQRQNTCGEYFQLYLSLVQAIDSDNEMPQAELILQQEVAELEEGLEGGRDEEAIVRGQLQVISSLLSALVGGSGPRAAVQKLQKPLLRLLFDSLLFPESRLLQHVQDSATGGPTARRLLDSFPVDLVEAALRPKCGGVKSRQAGFDLLLNLMAASGSNLSVGAGLILQQLRMAAQPPPEAAQVREDVRSGARDRTYMGLRNAGATCYMNSVLQQLYMQPTVRRFVLCADVPHDRSSVFFAIQHLFATLSLGRQGCCSPLLFWQNFRDYDGQQMDLGEHQDAYEFFTRLQELIDQHLLDSKQQPAMSSTMGGKFAQQIICHDVNYRSEKEQDFYQISVDVRGKATLEDSLAAYVQGERMEGDNAYHCEAIGHNVTATMRCCIKELPHTLVIHLKRFEYDYNTMMRLKIRDRFEFPHLLNMFPYTAEGLAASEAGQMGHQDGEDPAPSPRPRSYYQYELSGVVIHSGTAFAGHYYSFIRERACDSEWHRAGGSGAAGMRKPAASDDDCDPWPAEAQAEGGRWFRFDDTMVQPWEPSQMETDCFGGSTTVLGPGEISREYEKAQSALILFYERSWEEEPAVKLMAEQSAAAAAAAAASQADPAEACGKPTPMHAGADAAAAAAEMAGGCLHTDTCAAAGEAPDGPTRCNCVVVEGSSDGPLPVDPLPGAEGAAVGPGPGPGAALPYGMPSSLYENVMRSNLQFMHELHVHDRQYFQFMRQLVSRSLDRCRRKLRRTGTGTMSRNRDDRAADAADNGGDRDLTEERRLSPAAASSSSPSASSSWGEGFDQVVQHCVPLALIFVFRIYIQTLQPELIEDLYDWLEVLGQLVCCHPRVCIAVLQELCGLPGSACGVNLSQLVLQTPTASSSSTSNAGHNTLIFEFLTKFVLQLVDPAALLATPALPSKGEETLRDHALQYGACLLQCLCRCCEAALDSQIRAGVAGGGHGGAALQHPDTVLRLLTAYAEKSRLHRDLLMSAPQAVRSQQRDSGHPFQELIDTCVAQRLQSEQPCLLEVSDYLVLLSFYIRRMVNHKGLVPCPLLRKVANPRAIDLGPCEPELMDEKEYETTRTLSEQWVMELVKGGELFPAVIMEMTSDWGLTEASSAFEDACINLLHFIMWNAAWCINASTCLLLRCIWNDSQMGADLGGIDPAFPMQRHLQRLLHLQDGLYSIRLRAVLDISTHISWKRFHLRGTSSRGLWGLPLSPMALVASLLGRAPVSLQVELMLSPVSQGLSAESSVFTYHHVWAFMADLLAHALDVARAPPRMTPEEDVQDILLMQTQLRRILQNVPPAEAPLADAAPCTSGSGCVHADAENGGSHCSRQQAAEGAGEVERLGETAGREDAVVADVTADDVAGTGSDNPTAPPANNAAAVRAEAVDGRSCGQSRAQDASAHVGSDA